MQEHSWSVCMCIETSHWRLVKQLHNRGIRFVSNITLQNKHTCIFMKILAHSFYTMITGTEATRPSLNALIG